MRGEGSVGTVLILIISGDIEVTAGEGFINGFSILSQMDLVR